MPIANCRLPNSQCPMPDFSFIDTHTHCYSGEFDSDRSEVIHRAIRQGVTRMFLPAIDSGYTERLLKLASDFPEHCLPMAGLHPTSVKENYREELDHVAALLSDSGRTFYAVGEIGIDLYWDRTFEKEQIEVFNRQLDLAVQYGLPAVIHTRNSMDLALEILETRNDKGMSGIFHCFSGNLTQAKRAIALGFLLGIGGVVTYRNSGLQTVVEQIPLDHLVLETDAPWLPPVPHRGSRNEPSYIPLIAEKIADLKKVIPDLVARTTTENAAKLFRINS